MLLSDTKVYGGRLKEKSELLSSSSGGAFDVLSESFKDKRNGWKKPTAFATLNGVEVPINKYGKNFYSRKSLRLSCHKCPYTCIKRTTDITIGDFWHIEDKIPEQYTEDDTSFFIIHTEKGLSLFEKVKDQLDWFESNTSDCWQINLEMPTSMDKHRDKFCQDYYQYGIEYIITKYGFDGIADRIKRKVNKMLPRGVLEYINNPVLSEKSNNWRAAA